MTPCQKLLKQEGTARWIESMQQSSATPKNRDVGRGLRKIVARSQSTSQCLLVSTVFGTVSSFFIFNDFYTCFTHFSQQCIGIGYDTVGKQRKSYINLLKYIQRKIKERALCVVLQCSAPARRARWAPGMRIRMGT